MIKKLFLLLFLSKSAFSTVIIGEVSELNTGIKFNNYQVFIDNSTFSKSFQESDFMLNLNEVGSLDLCIWKKDYKISFLKIVNNAASDTLKLKVILTPEKEIININNLTATLNTKELELTKKILLGNIEGQDSLYFENPDVLLKISKKDTILFYTSEPLILVNPILGYKQAVFLEYLNVTSESYTVKFRRYFFMYSDNISQARHALNTYKYSKELIFKSLIEENWETYGFSFWTQEKRDEFKKLTRNEVMERVTISNAYILFSLPKELEVRFNDNSFNANQTCIYKITSSSKSDLKIYRNGYIEQNKNIIIKNCFGQNPISYDLPTDYTPDIKLLGESFSNNVFFKDLSGLNEAVYIHTNKEYYQSNELIYLKGYLNYKNPYLKGYLSNVLYVDLLDSTGQIVVSNTIKCEDGDCSSSINLPFEMSSGIYLMRAYTNWMKNYGDSTFFYKKIIINKTPKTTDNELINTSKILNISSYKLKSGDSLTVSFLDKSIVSSSISMATLSSFDNNTKPIINKFSTQKLNTIKYPIEKGLFIKGNIIDNDINYISNISQTSNSGKVVFKPNGTDTFYIENLIGSDSIPVSILATNAKGKVNMGFEIDKDFKEFESTDYLTNELASIQNNNKEYIESLPSSRIKPQYDPNAIILKELVVKERKTEDANYRKQRTFLSGEPSDSILAENLIASSSPNFISALTTKVPGLIIYYNPNTFSTSLSIRNTSPAIYVDGVKMRNMDDLSHMMLHQIYKIDVYRRSVTSTGDPAVIAIYTNLGVGKPIDVKPKDNPAPVFKIKGFDNNKDFYSSNSSNDNAIHWSSHNFLNKDSLSFVVNAKPGKYIIDFVGYSLQGEIIKERQLVEVY